MAYNHLWPIIICGFISAVSALELRYYVFMKIGIVVPVHFIFRATVFALKYCSEVSAMLRNYLFNSQIIVKQIITIRKIKQKLLFQSYILKSTMPMKLFISLHFLYLSQNFIYFKRSVTTNNDISSFFCRLKIGFMHGPNSGEISIQH